MRLRYIIALALFVVVGSSAFAQPTLNSAYLNASRLQTGFVPPSVLGTNAADNVNVWVLVRTANRLKWILSPLSSAGTVYATNVNYAAASPITFTTNADGSITIGVNLTSVGLAAATNETTRQINSFTNIYPSLGTAISDISLATNYSYSVGTNNGGGNALVSGSPGTGMTAILTNITTDTTLKAMTFWNNGLSVIPLYASCSGGANKQLKFSSVQYVGAGDLYGIDLNATGITITNGEASWFEIRCIYGVKTNVFRSNTK